MKAVRWVSRTFFSFRSIAAIAILAIGAAGFAFFSPLFLSISQADSTAAMSPSVSTEGTAGAGVWSTGADIQNIFASDDVYASTEEMQPLEFSGALRASGFDFSLIPEDAIIRGVEVKIERHASEPEAITDRVVRLFLPGGSLTDNKANTLDTWPAGVDQVATYGGNDDLWGTLLNASDIRSGQFTVVVLAQNSSTENDAIASIDHISVAVTYDIPIDSTRPSVAIESLISDPTQFSPIPFSATFSEAMIGFDQSDVVVSGGTLEDFTAVSSSLYTFMISPGSDPSSIAVSIAEGAATDAAGNTNTAGTYSHTYDSTVPQLVITSGPDHGSVLTNNQASYSFTSTGELAACALDVIPAIGASECSTFSDGSGTHDLTDIPDGLHTIYIKVASSTRETVIRRSFTVDTQRPTAQLSSQGVINGWASSTVVFIDIQFSDAVIGFNNLSSDVIISGGSTGGLTGSDASYSFRIQAADSASVTAQIPAGVATDANGSGWTNTASEVLSFSVDTQIPTVDIIGAPEEGSATSSRDVSISFEASDNNALTLLCSVDGTATSTCSSPYAATSLSDGTHTFYIEALDPAGNSAFASRSFSVDGTAPILAEISGVGRTTDTTPEYSFTSSEEGTLAVGGSCSAPSISVSSGTTTFSFSELSIGTYSDCTISVNDAVGNASTPLSVTTFTVEAQQAPAPASTGGNGPILSSPTQAPIAQQVVSGQVLGQSTASPHAIELHSGATPASAPMRPSAQLVSVANVETPETIEIIEATSSIPLPKEEYIPPKNDILEKAASQAAAVRSTGSEMPLWMYALFAAAIVFASTMFLRSLFRS